MKKKLRWLSLGIALAVALGCCPAGVSAEVDRIEYLDENGEMVTDGKDCTLVTADDTAWGEPGVEGWYAIDQGQSITIDRRVTVLGDVHLILSDGAKLTVNGGIQVGGGSGLTIYAQSAGDAMGSLTADASETEHAGIGGNNKEPNGDITINGGAVTATGGANDSAGGAAGIGGGGNAYADGTITINGGRIKAAGGSTSNGGAAGIGAGGSSSYAKKIVITGGEIEATAGENGAAAIGGGGHDGRLESVSITGGVIRVKGYGQFGSSENANGIGGGTSQAAADPSSFSDCLISDLQTKTIRLYGDPDDRVATLTGDYTIDVGWTLEIPKDNTLVVPEGKTITNNGTFRHAGKLQMNGTLTGSGRVEHVLYDGEPVDSEEHSGVCGCGETVSEAHRLGTGYQDQGDGTHTDTCSLCGYETAPEAHRFGDTRLEDGAYRQTCAGCGAERTVTVSAAAAGITYDLSGEQAQAKLVLSVETEPEAEGFTYQWQKQETREVVSAAVSEIQDEEPEYGYYNYVYEVPEGGAVAFRYQFGENGGELKYGFSGSCASQWDTVRSGEAADEVISFTDLPAGTYRLVIRDDSAIHGGQAMTLEAVENIPITYETYADLPGADSAEAALAPENGVYRVRVTLDGQTVTRDAAFSRSELAVTGVTAQDAAYDGNAHPGYTGTPAAEGYGGEIRITYQQKSGNGYTDLAGAPVQPGDYRVVFTLDPGSDVYGLTALDFSITGAAADPDSPADPETPDSEDGDAPQTPVDGAVQTGDPAARVLIPAAVMMLLSLTAAGLVLLRKRNSR